MLSTANEHKADEIRRVLAALGVELLPRPTDVAEVDETADTLEGNAFLKARALTNATGEAAIADDTGLFIDALEGRPGVYSARYAGERASYAENVARVLRELSSADDAKRTARFRTVIAVTYPDGATWSVEGVLEGSILTSPRGHEGFGYDPVFAPLWPGGTSLAEMAPEQKDAVSHRGKALRAFAERLSIS
ncbi:MAG: RdgB/HAM1 family non-canonical purine NTP pyrophosphatase [Acidimicrobiales bacterium]